MRNKQTRDSILQQAVQVASVEGLEGLSIGKLAEQLEMSKSGLFAHFGSKEELQIATLDQSWQIMSGRLTVAKPDPGLPHLQALLEAWLRYLQDSPFRGGCIFMAASLEFDGRPGKVRDHLLNLALLAQQVLLKVVSHAQALGHLKPQPSSMQMTFELHALLQAANNAFQLSKDPLYFELSRAALEDRINAWSSRGGA